MRRATIETTTPTTRHSDCHRRRGVAAATVSVATVAALLFSSCGGGDDDATEASPSTVAEEVAAPSPTATTTTTAAPTTTTATTTTTLALVTEGATLVVANASGINGAAGRMTDALAVAGFSTGAATDSSEGQLSTTKIYFDPENENAEAVANSVRDALGGGAIEVSEMGAPAPVDSGEIGDASIVVAMGNDVSDKPLAELQGLVEPVAEATTDSTDAPAEETTDSTEAPTETDG